MSEMALIYILRAQAWERVKAELATLRATFTSQEDNGTLLYEAGACDEFEGLVQDFVKAVEGAGFGLQRLRWP